MLPGDSDFGSMCQSEGSLNQTSFLSPSIPMLPQLRAVLALLGSCAGTVGGFLSFPLHQCPCSLLFRKGSLFKPGPHQHFGPGAGDSEPHKPTACWHILTIRPFNLCLFLALINGQASWAGKAVGPHVRK